MVLTATIIFLLQAMKESFREQAGTQVSVCRRIRFDTRYVTRYIQWMIRSFKHKGLAKFFKSGSTAGIQAAHAKRLRLILGRLNAAANAKDMDLPGLRLHELSGNRVGIWSVTVSGNWRVTFRFEDGDAEIVNYEDYH